jgi:hypothetical protein
MPTAEDAATLQAYAAGVDEVARKMERKWGLDRLPMLVDDELRAKFWRQHVKWYDTLAYCWGEKTLTRAEIDEAIARCEAMKRAWLVLDAQAVAGGHSPQAEGVYEVRLKNGSVAALCVSTAAASQAIHDGRWMTVWTLEEIGNVIDVMPELIRQAKHEWPGITVLPCKRAPIPEFNDGIPF